MIVIIFVTGDFLIAGRGAFADITCAIGIVVSAVGRSARSIGAKNIRVVGTCIVPHGTAAVPVVRADGTHAVRVAAAGGGAFFATAV